MQYFFLPRENIMRFHNDFDMMKDPDQSNVEARIVICAQWVHPFTQTLYIRSGYIYSIILTWIWYDSTVSYQPDAEDGVVLCVKLGVIIAEIKNFK